MLYAFGRVDRPDRGAVDQRADCAAGNWIWMPGSGICPKKVRLRRSYQLPFSKVRLASLERLNVDKLRPDDLLFPGASRRSRSLTCLSRWLAGAGEGHAAGSWHGALRVVL